MQYGNIWDYSSGTGGDDLTAEMSQKTYERLLKLGIMLAAQGFPVFGCEVRRQQ